MPGPCLADGQRPWADSRLPCLWPWDPSVTCMPSIMTAELRAGWPGGAPCPLWTGLPPGCLSTDVLPSCPAARAAKSHLSVREGHCLPPADLASRLPPGQ